MTDSEPLFVYKIFPSSTPIREPLPEQLPVSEIDEKSGYIHLSTAFQVQNTLETFFKDELFVYILRIPYEGVGQDIRWESPEGKCGPRPAEGLFPHLYNGLKLGREDVESVGVWTNQEGWDKALTQARPWLLY